MLGKVRLQSSFGRSVVNDQYWGALPIVHFNKSDRRLRQNRTFTGTKLTDLPWSGAVPTTTGTKRQILTTSWSNGFAT